MASIYRRRKGGCYCITYQVRPGKRKTVRGCRDRAATEALARKLEADAMLRREGVIDARAEKLAQWESAPIEQHLDAFEQVMRGKGSTAKHIRTTLAYIRRVNEACGFERPADIDAACVTAHVVHVKREGAGARAINARLTAFKSFTRWMFRNERLRTDPMMQVAKLNAKTDRRRKRRALSDEELAWLISATEVGPAIGNMTGPERSMLYRLAVETGLRASELRSLTPESFGLADLGRATVTVEAAYSKHRRDDVVPLRRDLAEALATFLEDRQARTAVFAMPTRTAEMLKADLEAARQKWIHNAPSDKERKARQRSGFLTYKDPSDRIADFHALRHTFITRLARSGITPAVAKSLARHSTITLTMDHYTHTLIEDERSALARLPGIEAVKPEREAAHATGTDNAVPHADAAPQTPGARCAFAARRLPGAPELAITRQDDRSEKKGGEGAQVVVNTTTCAHSPTHVNGGPPGIRTPDPLIKSQLLCQLS